MRDPIQELIREFRETFGTYTVDFETMLSTSGNKYYKVTIRNTRHPQWTPMVSEYENGPAWSAPSAALTLACMFENYLDLEDMTATELAHDLGYDDEDPKTEHLIKRLDEHEKAFEASCLSYVTEYVKALSQEVQMDFKVVAPFLIEFAQLDGEKIPIEGTLNW